MEPEDNSIFEDQEAVYAIKYLISCGYELDQIAHAFVYIDQNGDWKEE